MRRMKSAGSQCDSPAALRDNGDRLPPLMRDRSFWAMTGTQFLGAFNDNVYKMLVLLTAVKGTKTFGMDLQGFAQGVFSLPFILMSGFAGFMADRHSKQKIIVLAKVAEIVVMTWAAVVFFSGGSLHWLLVVLFFMGTQSTFFGPAKYGILPEMLRGADLPRANGWIQMTTFLAIIFGTAGAGWLKAEFGQNLWIGGLVCVGIAIAGTATSLLIRPVQAARPDLQFSASALLVRRDTWRMLRGDRLLWQALAIYTLFWFVGGIALPAVVALGENQLGVGADRTGLLAACIGLGIAGGCIAAGKLSREQIAFHLVRWGAWGVIVAAFALSISLPGGQHLLGYRASMAVLVAMGFFAGLLAVPLQVLLQARPPEGQKGRMIGAMNLFTWVGIFLSAVVYQMCVLVIKTLELQPSAAFSVAAAMLLPVALFYHPRDQAL